MYNIIVNPFINKLLLVIGGLLVIAGFAVGIYVGLWLCFIGGIVDLIVQLKSETLNASVIAWALFKIISSGFLGAVSGLVVAFIGALIIASTD